jgi:hypothetical protein
MRQKPAPPFSAHPSLLTPAPMGTFRRQFTALAWKNILGFVQHPFVRACTVLAARY